MEWLDDPRSVLMMKTILGVDFNPTHKRGHKPKRVNSLSPKLSRKLEEWNKWDLKLYEYVEELVFERMSSFVINNNTLKAREYFELLDTDPYWRGDRIVHDL